MTVIFACTIKGGAAIGADTLLHDPETGAKVMNSSKILNIGQRVSIAQAGSFNGTEQVWESLNRMDPYTATPTIVAETIRNSGGPIYENKSNSGLTSMRYLVAGLETDGTPMIQWLEFDNDKFGGVSGPGHIAALGTQANITQIATGELENSINLASNGVRLDKWCQQIVANEAAASPQFVGFPAVLIIMKEQGGIGKTIRAHDLPEASYEVPWRDWS